MSERNTVFKEERLMANIIDYVRETGEFVFHEKTFNPVDSLVLSQLSYIKFDGIVSGLKERNPYITLKEICDHSIANTAFQNVLDSKNNETLFTIAAQSQRFGGMKLNFFIDDIDESAEKQFSAITFLLDDGTAFIAVRGTDETVIGWKEDFNMAFMSPVPSQVQGVEYFNKVAESTACGLRIGGHSKGGNISVYAAMKCKRDYQDRIIDIYSHDGPGFRNEIFSDDDYMRIRDRIHKYLPQSSVVGMFLQSQEEYSIVDSHQIGLLQHDLFTWQIDRDDFKYKDALKDSSIIVNTAVNEWLNSIDDVNRKKFIDTFYHVIQSSEISTLFDLTVRQRKTTKAFLKAIQDIDPNTRRFVLKTIRSLFSIAAKSSRKLRMTKIIDFIKGLKKPIVRK